MVQINKEMADSMVEVRIFLCGPCQNRGGQVG